MSAEALARVLCSADGLDPDARERCAGPLWEGYVEDARRILADPAPLLAALAEAGVLTEEWAVQMLLNDGSGGKVITGWDNARYTREQAVADARSHGNPDADGNPRHWCRLIHRHVSDWTPTDPEAQP